MDLIEIAIPSPNDSKRTSYVMISKGKCRFVDEVHIPNAELRVRTLSAFLVGKRFFSQKEPCLRPRGSGKLLRPSSSNAGAAVNSGLQIGYKNGASFTTKMNDNLTHRCIGTR